MNYQERKERIYWEIEELENHNHKMFLKASLMLVGILSTSSILAISLDMVPIFIGSLGFIFIPYGWFHCKTSYETYEIERLSKKIEELNKLEKRDNEIEQLKNKISNLSSRERNIIIEMLSNDMEYTDFIELAEKIVKYDCADFLFEGNKENKFAKSFVPYNFKFEGNNLEKEIDLDVLPIDLGNCRDRKIKKKTNGRLNRKGKEF